MDVLTAVSFLHLGWPFTICMAICLIAIGIYAQTHVGPLASQINQNLGHSPQSLWDGGFHRVFTSLFFTAGGWHFYCSILMFVIGVGWVEHQYGTQVAASAFFGIHLLTLFIMFVGVLLWKSLARSHRSDLLWYARDVGPSAGYYGCLGLAINSLPVSISLPSALAIIVVLLWRLSRSVTSQLSEGHALSADIAHLIAFPIGLMVAWLPWSAVPPGTALVS